MVNHVSYRRGIPFYASNVQIYLRSVWCPNFMGSRAGAVVRALASHQCGQGSIPGLGGLSLLLVLVLAPRGFSPGTPDFPSLQISTLLNSNSIWKVSPISDSALNTLTLK